jgi:hypothetical protein
MNVKEHASLEITSSMLEERAEEQFADVGCTAINLVHYYGANCGRNKPARIRTQESWTKLQQ